MMNFWSDFGSYKNFLDIDMCMMLMMKNRIEFFFIVFDNMNSLDVLGNHE